jgi:aconitate hydratase
LVVLAGKAYGSGSSRDWAAKGVYLLGVRAVIAESYERIHRTNLVCLGVLPLQFMPGESIQKLGIRGDECFTIQGTDITSLKPVLTVTAQRPDGGPLQLPCHRTHRYAAGSDLLPGRRADAQGRIRFIIKS